MPYGQKKLPGPGFRVWKSCPLSFSILRSGLAGPGLVVITTSGGLGRSLVPWRTPLSIILDGFDSSSLAMWFPGTGTDSTHHQRSMGWIVFLHVFHVFEFCLYPPRILDLKLVFYRPSIIFESGHVHSPHKVHRHAIIQYFRGARRWK